MSKYENGKIYTIRCKSDESLIYVGSTIESRLSARFAKHKTQKHCSLYKFINNPENNTFWGDWYIELHEEFSCDNKMQLVKRENEIIRQIATINKIGYRTEEMIKEYNKNYRESHKEEIKERYAKYAEKNREKILEKKKDYNENNKEHKLQYMKERYTSKKEEILQYEKEKRLKNSEKITCECGSICMKYKMCDHIKTKKHLSFLESKIK